MVWMWLVAVILGTLPIPACSYPAADSIQILLSRGPVDWSAVPPAYRRLLYMNRDNAPTYPEDADSLLQVRNWLATRVIEGEPFDLECKRRGWNYSARYVRRSAKQDPERTLTTLGGPSYSWRSDSTLATREYVTPEKWEAWYYDSSGVLIHYEFKLRESVRLLGERVSVWFSREGVLIGFAVDGDAYWMGRRGTVGEMFYYLAEYYHWPKGLR